jgi:hypothetical protein
VDAIKNFLEHPGINLFVACILVFSSLAEGWEEFTEDLSEFDLGVHHGVLLLGVAMLLRSIIEVLESIVRAHERQQKSD